MKISIITVTYNSAATLRDTMQSVLNQTFNDIEYILVDGNSNDNTVSVIKEFEPLFKGRLRWVSEPDKGIYDAMNKGIKMATGDIIGILNSDDFFASDSIIEKVSSTFEADESIEGVYADVTYVNYFDTQKIVRRFSANKFIPKKILFGMMPPHPSFYVKKSCYDRFGLYSLDYPICADYDIFVRLLWLEKIKTTYIPLNFVFMRNGGTSSSGLKVHKKIMKERLKCIKEHHLKSNFFMQSLRYFGKVADLIRK